MKLDAAGLSYGGAKRDRTADLLSARQALSQLSYSPVVYPKKRKSFLTMVLVSKSSFFLPRHI